MGDSLHAFRRVISKRPKEQGIWERYPETIALVIRFRDDLSFEVHDICPTETVGGLKARLLEITKQLGPHGSPGPGRLTYKGGLLSDDRVLASIGSGFGEGSELRWVNTIGASGLGTRSARVDKIPFRM